jgi:DNA repair protein RecN (Recombination protein N)
MIRFLSIQNLAVVDELELELQPGLTVLTGETGAGKSIILGAVGLLVGGRATSDLVRTGQLRARVQATIEDDKGEERILRREVTAQGRSRGFIDDTLATNSALKEVGRRFIDLHGQHDHQALLDPASHLSLLDAYAGLDKEAATVGEAYRNWRGVRGRLEQLQRNKQERSDRIELLAFQREEIEKISPTVGEDARLQDIRLRLANSDRLVSLCTEAYNLLYERDDSILANLGQIWKQIDELVDLDQEFAIYAGGRDSVESQLEDLAFFLRSYAQKVETSPDKLAAVEERLANLEQLKRKYGPSLIKVVEHGKMVEEELAELRTGNEELEILLRDETEQRGVFERVAERLSNSRQAAAPRLMEGLKRILAGLAIPGAQLETRFERKPVSEDQWTERGVDSVEFFFSANPGEAVRPLAKVASGGELSRLMLSLKSLATTDRIGKTLVFDEIDAGIGGAVADRVGAMLRELSREYQVICVTHLPQIAVYATSHHHVSKVVQKGRTVTRIEELADETQVTELARLMTGADSAGARAGAREMLESKEKTKAKGERRKAKAGG